jgi:ankyrin repeat protein
MLNKSAYSRYYLKYEDDVKRGVPPIFAAIQNHLYQKLSEILNEDIDIEMKNKFGNTPLQFAYYQHDDKLIKILLEHNANPNIGKGRYSLLSRACVVNRISTVKLLLEYGADVNYQYNKSESALTVAVKGCKNFELVRLLFDNVSDVSLVDSGDFNIIETLHIHCRNNENGHREMLDLIYEYASDDTNRLTH